VFQRGHGGGVPSPRGGGANSGRPGVQVGDWVQDNWAVRALAQWNTISDPALVEVSASI